MQQLGRVLETMRQGVSRGQLTVDADVQYHQVSAQATGNRDFVDIQSQLGRAIIPRAREDTPRLGQDDPALYLERVNREHEDIYNAIERRDPEGARAAMRTHLTNSRERLRQAQLQLEQG